MDKPYYRRSFNRCMFVDEDYNIDIDFMRIAKKQQKLTFNTIYLNREFDQCNSNMTPFNEIKLYDNFYSPDFSVLKLSITYQDLLNYILKIYKNVLRNIDPRKKYLCSCSAGSDSRILCALLAQLRDEEGYNLDNILFHCWGRTEKDSFLQLMERLKFKNISIFDDTVDDAFDVGTDEIPTNFYTYAVQMKFWGPYNPSEYVLLGGAEEALVKFPFKIFTHKCSYFCTRGEHVHYLANVFQDVFFPLLSPEMIQISASIPDNLKGIHDKRIDRDKLRTDLCEILGVADIPMPISYFNLNLSQDRKKLMIDLYEKSKFNKYYNFKLNYDELFKNYDSFDAKVWGFAVTVYERLFG